MAQDIPIALLGELYSTWSHRPVTSIIPLPESGSYRRYFRISDVSRTFMGVYNTDNRENSAFIYLDRHLQKTGNRVPEIFCEDLRKNIYIEQDLGDTTLLDYLEQIRGSVDQDEKTISVYRHHSHSGCDSPGQDDREYTKSDI